MDWRVKQAQDEKWAGVTATLLLRGEGGEGSSHILANYHARCGGRRALTAELSGPIRGINTDPLKVETNPHPGSGGKKEGGASVLWTR